MKKMLLIVLLVTVVVCLCGCQGSNRQLGLDTSYSFKWAIVQIGNGEIIEGEVTSWRDFDDSDVVQFVINGITYLTHYSNVILCSERP